MVKLSILDILPIPEGATPADALTRAADLAVAAEGWGYNRYWVAEHHNMIGAACSATSTVITYVAGQTRHIRVGAGGVMLPNHAPLTVAEQFGTIKSLYPGRIDLGLGRAPGTDPATAQALRRDDRRAMAFHAEVAELRGYFETAKAGQVVRAVPGAGLDVPIWILGASPSSGVLAGELGLPYAFASHFAPGELLSAIQAYRHSFKPSTALDRPYVMLGVNAVVANSQSEADRLFTTILLRYVNVVRGTPRELPPPVDDMQPHWTAQEERKVRSMLSQSYVGSADTVRDDLLRLAAATGADELIVSATLFGQDDRKRSYELLASAMSPM